MVRPRRRRAGEVAKVAIGTIGRYRGPDLAVPGEAAEDLVPLARWDDDGGRTARVPGR